MAFTELFENMWQWDSPTFAKKFCYQVGSTMIGAFDMSGIGEFANPFVMHAEPMCNCVVHNIVDIAEGNFDLSNMGSLMECAGSVAAYVEGAMSGFYGWPMPNMDHGMDHDMDKGDYSEENIRKVVMEIYDQFSSIEFNEDQIKLMTIGDTTGEMYSLINSDDRNMRMAAVAMMVIWNDANMEHDKMGYSGADIIFGMLEQAGDFVQFYDNNMRVWKALNGMPEASMKGNNSMFY